MSVGNGTGASNMGVIYTDVTVINFSSKFPICRTSPQRGACAWGVASAMRSGGGRPWRCWSSQGSGEPGPAREGLGFHSPRKNPGVATAQQAKSPWAMKRPGGARFVFPKVVRSAVALSCTLSQQ